MKKGAIAIVYFLASVALIIVGMIMSNMSVLIAGIALLVGGAVLLSIAMMIVAIVRARKKLNSPEGYKIDENDNSTMARAERAVAFQTVVWRLSSAKDKIFGTVFLVSFVGCLILFVVFCSMDKLAWGLIAWGCGLGVWLLGALVAFITNRKERKKRGVEYEECKGKVLTCAPVQREGKTEYEVVLTAAGRRAVGYAKRAYREGEIVDIKLDMDHARAYFSNER